MKTRIGVSALISIVLVPAAAVAAIAIARPGAPAETAPTTVAVSAPVATAPPVTSVRIEPVTSTDTDLVLACTVDGLELVALEAEQTISELQSAALDALRQVCAESGLALPGPPAPEPEIRTVTVLAGPSAQSATAAITSPPASDGDQSRGDDEHEDEGEHEDEREEDERSGSETEYLSALADAQSAIAAAVSAGGDEDKLQEAYEQLDEAQRKAARGNFHEAAEKAREAEAKAKEALRGGD